MANTLQSLERLKHVFGEFAQQKLWRMFFFYMTIEDHTLVITPLDLENWMKSLASSPIQLCLVPLDFHLVGPLKETHCGIHFEDEEAAKTSVRQ
ncbi:hypothetical protein Trydic_g3119 [Trypoxylus dichotomus]